LRSVIRHSPGLRSSDRRVTPRQPALRPARASPGYDSFISRASSSETSFARGPARIQHSGTTARFVLPRPSPNTPAAQTAPSGQPQNHLNRSYHSHLKSITGHQPASLGSSARLSATDSNGKPSKGRVRGIGPRFIRRQTCGAACETCDVTLTKNLATRKVQ
jgi:hypothetical protein